ncbi:hypothetical protein WJX72_006593 [[Myrmecia] bisecta]|uniref:Uncharacterized protein n=1 Tax=[Myrmecia] bisecta TaxID=41462 RepID=A0AAW1R899_9CHLO
MSLREARLLQVPQGKRSSRDALQQIPLATPYDRAAFTCNASQYHMEPSRAEPSMADGGGGVGVGGDEVDQPRVGGRTLPDASSPATSPSFDRANKRPRMSTPVFCDTLISLLEPLLDNPSQGPAGGPSVLGADLSEARHMLKAAQSLFRDGMEDMSQALLLKGSKEEYADLTTLAARLQNVAKRMVARGVRTAGGDATDSLVPPPPSGRLVADH